jgi:hypothetical protein
MGTEIFSMLGNVLINKGDAMKDIDEVTGHAEKSEPKVGGAMKKIGLAIGGAFAVGQVVAFGKKMIETTASLQAMRAQFDQVFGQDSETAQKKINAQAAELGIHADRLTDSWNSFGAQTKGAGMDAAKSLEATEKATRLAADSAAFYDTNLETASASIASFMKGNFAAGDAIGVFTNAKQMDVKANEKYGKSWADLSEEERQWLLLDTIDKTYELNGAMGQAARESDSWANQTGNLKAAWNGFLEKIGTPVLGVAVKVVKSLSEGVMWLAEQAETYLVPVFEDVVDFVGDNLTPIFQDLKDWFVENWPKIKDAVMDAYNKIKPAFDRLVESVKDYIIPIVQDLWERFQTIWPGIQALFEAVFPIIVDLIAGAFDAISNVIDIIKGIYDAIKPGLDGAAEIFGSVFKGIADAVNKVKDALQWAIDKLNLWNNTKMGSKSANVSTTGLSSSGREHGGGGRAFATGSRYIPFDMEATVHEGEMIVPKSENPYANSGGKIMPLTKVVPLPPKETNQPRNEQANNRIIFLLEKLVDKKTDIYLDKTKVGGELYDEFDDTMTRNIDKAEWELGGAF